MGGGGDGWLGGRRSGFQGTQEGSVLAGWELHLRRGRSGRQLVGGRLREGGSPGLLAVGGALRRLRGWSVRRGVVGGGGYRSLRAVAGLGEIPAPGAPISRAWAYCAY